jgi:hypothetical protein
MQRCFFQTCLLLAFLTACAPASTTSFPPQTPSLLPTSSIQPTLLSATFQPTALPTGSATRPPTVEIGSPTPESITTLLGTFTLEPTITASLPSLPTSSIFPTQEATSIPQPVAGSAAIQFDGPGPLSKFVSPVQLYGYAIPGYGSKGLASLYGEDGSLLDSEILQLNTANTWAYFYWTLDFQVQGAGELGRLTMSTQDAYGRLTAVYSVHLILLSEGFTVVNPPGDSKERCLIDKPAAGFRISAGILSVQGEMRAFNSLPLVIKLIDRAGNVLAAQPVAIAPAPNDSYVPFQVSLPYSIPRGTWARLSVEQPDDRIPGMMYLYSREVYLNP